MFQSCVYDVLYDRFVDVVFCDRGLVCVDFAMGLRAGSVGAVMCPLTAYPLDVHAVNGTLCSS